MDNTTPKEMKARSMSSFGIRRNSTRMKFNNTNRNNIVKLLGPQVENIIEAKEEQALADNIEVFRKKEDEDIEKGNTRDYIISLFSKPLFAELFFAWSRDCEDVISIENAKFFREELIMRENKDDKNYNFRSLRVSKNFLVAFVGNLATPIINKLDLSDNLITDICLHNIKSLIVNKKIVHLNLSSNMISSEGLKIIHNEVMNSETLKYLNVCKLYLYLAWYI